MLTIRSLKAAVVAFIATVIFSYIFVHSSFAPQFHDWLQSNLADDEAQLAREFVHLWLPSQLPVFAAGIGSFYAIRDHKWTGTSRAFRRVTIGLFIFLLIRPVIVGNIFEGIIDRQVEYALLFAGFAYVLANGAAKWMIFPAIIYLGKVSFSAYLWHFLVMSLIGEFALSTILNVLGGQSAVAYVFVLGTVVLLTVALSSITYRIIELPGIKLGRAVARRIPTGATIALKRN